MRVSTLGGLLLILAMACAGPAPTTSQDAIEAAEPTLAPAPTNTPQPTSTPEPTSTPSPSPTPVPLTESFADLNDGFQIQYPEGWTVQAIDFATMISHPIGTNITVATEDASGISLEEYLAVSLEEFKIGLGISGTTFEDASTIKLEGREAYRVTGRSPETDVDPAISFTILVTLVQERGYFIAASARQSLVDQHQPILNTMLASLVFFDPSEFGPVDDHGDTTGAATGTSANAVLVGNVESLTDIDFFSFPGKAGTSYQASVELGTLADALVVLYAEGGTCVLTGSNGESTAGTPILRWPIEKDGTYFLSVENAAGDSTGTYSLRLLTTDEAKTDDHGSDLCSASPIEPSVDVDAVLEDASDIDWFSFQAQAGSTYTVFVALGSLEDSLLTLWDVDGTTLLDENDDFGATLGSRIDWTAEESGSYFLGVENADNFSSGTYTITLQVE